MLDEVRYIVKSLANKRTFNSHESLRSMPKVEIPTELDMYDESGDIERDARDSFVDSNVIEIVERALEIHWGIPM